MPRFGGYFAHLSALTSLGLTACGSSGAASASLDTSSDASSDGAHGDDASSEAAACAMPLTLVSQAPACGEPQCGNDLIDNCGGCGGSPGPNCNGPIFEQCDGEEFDGATCESIGYSSGPLLCTSWCAFDDRACVACAAPGGSLVSCAPACIDADPPEGLALAATDQTVGLVWISRDMLGNALAHFALFDHDLHVIAQATPWPFSTTSLDSSLLAIAPSPTGWLVAVRDTAITVYPFDTSARVTSAPHVIPGADYPSFGTHAGSAPLLTWIENDDGSTTTRAALLSSDGSFETPPVDLSDPAVAGADILFVDGAFLVAYRANESIVTTRVGLDGRVIGNPQQPVGQFTEVPALAALVSGQIGLAFESYAPSGATLEWATLDTTGALVAGPVAIAPAPVGYPLPQLVSAGADALLLVTSTDSAGAIGRLETSHLDAQGTTTVAASTVARTPAIPIDRMVAQSDRAVIAFTDTRSIDLATVSLAAP